MQQKLIAKVHILKKQVGLDDASYRMMLKNVVGKDSCKRMSIKELTRVVEKLKGNNSKRDVEYIKTDCGKLKKIIKMWQQLALEGKVKDGGNRGLANFMRARFNVSFKYLSERANGQIVKDKIIEALKDWSIRNK